MEFDRGYERRWFKVEIDWIAAFVVRSYTEEGAMHKVDLYCQSEPLLGLNVEPQDGLNLYPEYAKPLEPLEEAYYNKLGDEITPVRLVEDRRHLGAHAVNKTITYDRSQLRLFTQAELNKL